MTTNTSGVPDLLRRFVPTPFSTTIAVGRADVVLHSNVSLAGIYPLAAPNEGLGTLIATIVCDSEAPHDGSAITLIKAWPVATVLVGAGTVLALDCERAEILGFLAPAVSIARFVEDLLPMLVDLYREMKSPTAPQSQQQ